MIVALVFLPAAKTLMGGPSCHCQLGEPCGWREVERRVAEGKASRSALVQEEGDCLRDGGGDSDGAACSVVGRHNAQVTLPRSALKCMDPCRSLAVFVEASLASSSPICFASPKSWLGRRRHSRAGCPIPSTGCNDPDRLHHNPLPPPVRVRAVDVDVDGRPVSPGALLQLPVAAQQIRIAYTALSLSIPERGRLRYRLEGVDQGWQDAGTRREAIHTNRRPGHYRFRVLAANQDGVWNERGAAMEIQIPSPFCLTSWFLALSALVVAGLLWLIYLRRLRVMETCLQARLAERHIKRERIARALHASVPRLRFAMALPPLPTLNCRCRETLPTGLRSPAGDVGSAAKRDKFSQGAVAGEGPNYGNEGCILEPERAPSKNEVRTARTTDACASLPVATAQPAPNRHER